ncbi:hypothetical protein BDN72DRAFT_877353 [Pluteus cervinus]|uniref:Uncharacterized protein n=1 Tax=Pluteus cervinus TaxID=181527 RepID=A0ACD3AZT3_9AGAR|nr:hypothetical protein BDN72DRAFT_877353 [Pluteus cervinus]
MGAGAVGKTQPPPQELAKVFTKTETTSSIGCITWPRNFGIVNFTLGNSSTRGMVLRLVYVLPTPGPSRLSAVALKAMVAMRVIFEDDRDLVRSGSGSILPRLRGVNLPARSQNGAMHVSLCLYEYLYSLYRSEMDMSGDEFISGNFKVPSIIWYDAGGDVQAIGAGAIRDGIEEEAEDGQWNKVEWFKLHLRPKSLDSDEVSQFAEKIPPIPPSKTIVDVFADFFDYLYRSSRAYIEEHHSSGRLLWSSVESKIEFVLSHPNGWEGPQQGQMREAAILAGLVPDTKEGKDRIHFVTEGEASLHFCISKNLMPESIESGARLMVVDAGGGTIDISTYEKAMDEMRFEEVAAPQCKLRGSIFVTQHARKHLKEYLSDSPFLRDVPDIVRNFDKSTKLRFRRAEEPAFVKFGSSRDNDPAHNIRSGQLKLKGDVVATFFQSSIDCITRTILEHRRDHDISVVFLVGGFAASDWLFNKVQEATKSFNITISRPDSHINKAVADGAVSFYVDHFVSTRVAKYHYGVGKSIYYDSSRSDHLARKHKIYTSAANYLLLPDGFCITLPKGTQVHEDKEFREIYFHSTVSLKDLGHVFSPIIFYRGPLDHPQWLDENPDDFQKLCTIEADIELDHEAATLREAPDGQTYYSVEYSVIFLFGLTEFKAQLAWMEHGIERRSPAQVIWTTN